MEAVLLIAENLKKHRTRLGMSREELAFLCGISCKTLCLIERGQTNPTLLNLDYLCKVLGITVIDLVSQ